MERDDRLIGSLRIPIRHLQELVNYLESRHAVRGDDARYCQRKVKEVSRHLRAIDQFVEREFCVASGGAAWLFRG